MDIHLIKDVYLFDKNQRTYEVRDLGHSINSQKDRTFFMLDPLFDLVGYKDFWGQYVIDMGKAWDVIPELHAYTSSQVLLYTSIAKHGLSNYFSLPNELFVDFKNWMLTVRFKFESVLVEVQMVEFNGVDPGDSTKPARFIVFMPGVENKPPVLVKKDGCLCLLSSLTENPKIVDTK